jgi:hypothetical protein
MTKTNKVVTGYTKSGTAILKTVPAITHSFNVGDRVECINYDGELEIGVVEVIDKVSKIFPYEWNSNLEISILVRFENSPESVTRFPQNTVEKYLRKI